MPLPISRLLRPPKIPKAVTLPNIQKAIKPLGSKLDTPGFVEGSNFSAGLKLLQEKSPHSVDQLQYIDKTMTQLSPSQLKGIRPITNRLLTLKPDDVSAVYKHFDTEIKVRKLTDVFSKNTDKTLKGNVLNSVKAKFRGVDQTFKNMSLRHENRLQRTLSKKSPEHLVSFSMLMKNPTRFREIYGLTQDEFAAQLIAPKATGNKVVDDLVETYRGWDKEVLQEIQASGIPIGSIDGYAAPLSMPIDAIYDIGEVSFREAFMSHVSNVNMNKGLERIIQIMKEKSTDFTQKSTINFPTRKLKFKSPLDEIQFYKKMNGIREGDGYSLVNDMLVHKKGIVRKAAIVSEFGVDPKQTFKKVLNELKAKNKKGLSHKQLDDYRKLETNFDRLVDSYNGAKKVDNIFAERLGETVSAATTFFTSASGSSYLRNLFDFSLNKAAVKQAVYNPAYSLGGAIYEQVENVGNLVAHALGGRASREGTDKVLDIMGFGSQLDTLSHFNLLSYENMYDVTSPLSKLDGAHSHMNNALHQVNNTLLTVSGQNSFTDFRRARHIMTAQQHWTNMLDNVKGFDDWFSSFSPIEQKQIQYMEQAFGIGKKEFEALKVVGRQKIKGNVFGKNIPEFITSESIVNSKVGDKFFRRELALKWQSMMYNSTLNATPVPTLADSVTAKTGLNNASSWMRFVIRPFMKFADVTDAQFAGVVDRVALASYGDRSQTLGFDKSMVNYTQAGVTYLGGFMGLIWLKDMLYNREPTDFTKTNNLLGAFVQSGFGGYPMSVLNQALSLYGTSGGGMYGPAPVGGVLRGGKTLIRGIASDDPVKFYKAMKQVSRLSGPGVLWYTRGIADKALQEALLTPSQRKKVRTGFDAGPTVGESIQSLLNPGQKKRKRRR